MRVAAVGLEDDRHLAVERRQQRFERRIVRRPLAGAADCLERGVQPLIMPGVEERLPAVGDDAHERARIAVAGSRASGLERDVQGDRGAQDRVARRRPAEADDGALADENVAVGRDQVGREAGLPPAVGLLVVGLQTRR